LVLSWLAEIALNFKEQGNSYFKGKRWREAAEFYTQGIDAKPTDKALLEVLHINRAACNLELSLCFYFRLGGVLNDRTENYGKVLGDCSAAITINVKSSKAYYRSALALVALERYDEAVDSCSRCLGFDPTNQPVVSLKEKAEKLHDAKVKKEQEKQERVRVAEEKRKRLQVAFRVCGTFYSGSRTAHMGWQERNLVVAPNPKGTQEVDFRPRFDEEDPNQSTLIFPVHFLYPQHATSDTVSDFNEDLPFGDYLTTMFPPNATPPNWDKAGEYVNGRLSLYAATSKKRLLKIGKKMTLRDVIREAGKDGDGLELQGGCLAFIVVPRGEVETNWIAEFKRNK
jgi:small subunit ribosomal protein S7e